MPGSRNGGHRADMEAHPPDREGRPSNLTTALAWVAGRRARDQAFEGSLFLNPAWDILLDIYINHAQGRRECVSNVCVASSAPATTVSRWVVVLEKHGLIERTPDPADRRRTLLGLTPEGLRRMEHALAASADSNARMGLERLRIVK